MGPSSQIKLLGGLPEEAVALLQAYLASDLGTMEFATRVEAMRARAQQDQVRLGV